MTDTERRLVTALRHAWQEMNAIRARDGVAYHHGDGMPYCTEGWWSDVVDMSATAIEAATGEPPKPWPFPWERGDSTADNYADTNAALSGHPPT